MNRFRFKKADFKNAKQYIKTKKGPAPNWAKREGVTVKNGKLFWQDKEIIASEDVETYLRKTIYDKDCKTPSSRDGAFHLIKDSVLGVSRAAVMDFLRGQKTLGETLMVCY